MFDSARPDEMRLVFDAWANSFRKSPWAGCVPNHLWDSVSRACASEIIDRGARVLVATVPLETGDRRVMGYSVSEPDIHVLHWLFVKKDFRGAGVGRGLLGETTRGWTEHNYTHRTRSAPRFLGAGWHWEPLYARVKR